MKRALLVLLVCLMIVTLAVGIVSAEPPHELASSSSWWMHTGRYVVGVAVLVWAWDQFFHPHHQNVAPTPANTSSNP